MDSAQAVGAMLGLGLLSGIRLYFTLFLLGLIVRFNLLTLPFPAEHLNALASTPVLALSGLACALEFVADKIPWVDSLWDSIHTFVRPIGAGLLGFAALDGSDPSTQWILAILAGGAAFTSHASKAGARLTVNHSPEPFSNAVLSVAEDLIVPAGIWFSLEYPRIALIIVLMVAAVFAWLAPKLFRILRLEWHALVAVVRRWGASGSRVSSVPGLDGANGQIERFVREKLAPVAQPLPDVYAEVLHGTPPSIHCSPAKGLRGLHRSIGYLCIQPTGLVFVTRRWFRVRTHAIQWTAIQSIGWREGLFLDTLSVQHGPRTLEFDVFKGVRERTGDRAAFSHQPG